MRKLVLFTISIIALTIPANGKTKKPSHADYIDAYTLAIVTSYFAENHCPALKANQVALVMMRVDGHFSDADDAEILLRIEKNKAMYAAAFEKIGRDKWCAHAQDIFGPHGSIVPGLVSIE